MPKDMSDSEKASFIDFMAGMVKEKSLRNAELQKTIDRQGERLDGLQASLDTIERMLKNSRHENNQLNAQLTEQGKILTSLRVELSSNTKALEKARREVEKYKSLYEVLKTEKFGSPSQKHKRPDPGCGRDDAKDDWDGTPDDPATGETSSEELDTEVDLLSESSKDRQERAYRQGLKYERMNARVTVMHKCDRSRIPAGAQIIKTKIRSTFHTVNRMEEHWVEYITFAFNKYMMETPVYREMIRLMELKFKVSRQTILNWLSKRAKALKKLIPVMKMEHIGYMVHVRAKFQKALKQGKDERAEAFVKWIGDLYKLEESYKVDHLSPNEIKRRRNSIQTREIISNIWQELTCQLDNPIPKGDLLTKALNYLEHAWTPVMAYRNDGRYDIDNSIAERSIRPIQPYHTFIATCKIGTLSFRSFLKKYFTAYMDGRTDYEHLTPAYLAESIK